MTQSRPKLLVLGGPHIDADALGETLGRYYDLIESSPDAAIRTLEGEGCQAVLAEAGDFFPLERDLVGRQSSMLLNAIGEGVCLIDRAGRVLWANQLYRDLVESVRKRVIEVCKHAVEQFSTEPLPADTADQATRARRFKLNFRKSQRYFEVLVSPVASRYNAPSVPSEGHGVPAVMLAAAVVRDVTSTERLTRKMDAIERAGQDLARMDADTVRRMHPTERLRLIEDRVKHYAHELLHFDHFAIRMLHPATNRLDLVMSSGIPEKARNIELYAESEGNGISGYVAATGESYISNDTSADPRYIFGLENPGSSLTVPLRVYDRIVGVFNIESSQKNAFNDRDRQFAQIFSSYIAGALHTLNLLLVEKHTTSEFASGTVTGEIKGPLNDLAAEVELLRKQCGDDSSLVSHLDRISRDVASIRRRMKAFSKGETTLLGADEIIETGQIDPVLQGKRILVADNDENIRELIRDVLSAVGCRVVTCDDATSAIRLLETWQHTFDADEGFDLVISDIRMDDRTGYDVFTAAREASAELPVLLMTGFGYDPHHSIVRATQEGLQGVLFKPFAAKTLIEDVRSAILKIQRKG